MSDKEGAAPDTADGRQDSAEDLQLPDTPQWDSPTIPREPIFPADAVDSAVPLKPRYDLPDLPDPSSRSPEPAETFDNKAVAAKLGPSSAKQATDERARPLDRSLLDPGRLDPQETSPQNEYAEETFGDLPPEVDRLDRSIPPPPIDGGAKKLFDEPPAAEPLKAAGTQSSQQPADSAAELPTLRKEVRTDPPPLPPRQPSARRVRPASSVPVQPRIAKPPPAAPGTIRMGILGGKASGKTYLMHAMVYRVQAAAQAGALSIHLKGGRVQLYHSTKARGGEKAESLRRFVKAYRSWVRLGFTDREQQAWHRLELTFRSGLAGGSESKLDIDFLDSSGEFLEMAPTAESRQDWANAYLGVGVMAFCLPLWTAFPSTRLSSKDLQLREQHLEGFESVVQNYRSMVATHSSGRKVRPMLLLTMADDRRGGLTQMIDSWITPYLESPGYYLDRLRRESGLARYLGNARGLSEMLHRQFARADAESARIPELLSFGEGRPWIVPVSAIDGAALEAVESGAMSNPAEPAPAHVELPLLLSLCETYNALM